MNSRFPSNLMQVCYAVFVSWQYTGNFGVSLNNSNWENALFIVRANFQIRYTSLDPRILCCLFQAVLWERLYLPDWEKEGFVAIQAWDEAT